MEQYRERTRRAWGRSRRRIAAAVAALTVAAAVAACTEDPVRNEETREDITVSGSFGSVPVVTFDPPLPLQESEVETLIEGDGRRLASGEPVLLTLTPYDGDDGELVEDREIGVARTLMLTPEDVGEDLYPVLSGSTEGSRLLVRQPVVENGEERMLVLVIDVRYTRARGEPVEPPEGLPTVTLADDGAPSITVPDTDPPDELVIAPLIRGEGAQVRPGQDVTVQYTGVEWDSGEPYDSTWETGKVPQTVNIDETIDGLRTGLVDQQIGSQVLLVIPPGLAHGTDTLVLVVDILAASGGDEDSVVGGAGTADSGDESAQG
ncbi:FKBP-type peptidyl-prolyl cis-trans isomerase [Georgenia subflava]|uniref:Peptidyl-prolyl cis-trans isomerase n=1 Tax=Georgenia subflava TaxID=1622177 RepID=A0A6N7EEE4_9MICO|nr:FKBP-type peptidyl-prolyl cis-trans isomerase [Georgenia subflava]MPV35711.1 FKBP-type peptidyl-prolyl cis-trans isomerase [Georgenia subflava]